MRPPRRSPSSAASCRSTLLSLTTLLLAASLFAPAALAQGGIAVAVTLPDRSPVHRDFAAGMVGEAYERFSMLTPQLSPEDVSRCETDEACLLSLARKRAASHLLLVGVASLGPSEYVVSLRVLDTANGAEVVNVSDLAEPGGDPTAAGRELAGRAFASATALPAKQAAATAAAVSSEDASKNDRQGPTTTKAPARAWTGLNPLSLVGWGVAGLGVVGAGAAVVVGIPLFSAGGSDIQTYGIWSGAGIAGLFAVGLGLVATDAYVLNPE